MLTDVTEFVSDHRPHGPLTADATEPAWTCRSCKPLCERHGRCGKATMATPQQTGSDRELIQPIEDDERHHVHEEDLTDDARGER